MKKILAVLLLSTSLSGCAVVATLYDSYFMAKYDNVEYALTNKLRTMSQLGVETCKDYTTSKNNFNDLYTTAIELQNFSQYVPRNVDTQKITGNLVELTKQGKEMYTKETVSETFCKLKMQQINRASEVAQKVIGSKPR